MSDLFIIGASASKAYRTSMAAIAENIANASTEGYARRSVTMAESGASSQTMALYVARANFGGVEARSIDRAADPYLDAAVRLTGQNLASADARQRWLSDTETAMNDTATGIGQLMSGMYGQIERLAASPNDTSLRVTTLDSINRVAEAFQRTARDLSDISDSIGDEATDSVSTLNHTMAALADINGSLLRATPGTAAYAQLLDSRDSALQSISETLNVDIGFGSNGTAIISYAGQDLVRGTTSSSLTMTANADGTLALSGASGALAAPASGQLGGLFSAAQTVTARRASLDSLAQQFVTDVNAWHAQGLTDAGAAGGALLSYGGSAATMAALITDPADLATRSADGTLNGNLLNAYSVLRGNGSVEDGWTALIASHANLLGAVKQEYTTALERTDQAVAAREAVSGVDLDMEAADLLRVQQAYSASAKVLQIAKETIDSILRII